jgi:hypothetical protein
MEKSIDVLILKMQEAIASNSSELVEQAVSEFAASFQLNANIITGKEYGLHVAARCYAWLGDKVNALEYIRLCEWNGYENFNSIADDDMFALFKDDKEFKEIFS